MSLKSEDYPVSNEHVIVGKVQHAHGIRGELFLFIFSKEAAWISQLKEVGLIRHSAGNFEHLKFRVRQKRSHKEGIIVKLEGVETRNQAEELKGAMFEVPESFFVSESESDFYLREILGFSLLSPEGAELGVIEAFSSNGFQDLAVVKTGSGRYDVPLVDEFIVKLSREEREIIMNLPLGLLGEPDDELDDDSAGRGE